MDRDLVTRAQRGDRQAFARLAALVITRMDATARLIVRDPDRAKDAVQEALVHAWRDLPTLRDPDRFEAWLRRLLVNASIAELRRDRRRLSVEVGLLETHDRGIADPTARLADREALERGFRRLSPEQRALVVLHYYEGIPLVDAARALAIPPGTAKSRLSRARDALRAALEADARISETALEVIA